MSTLLKGILQATESIKEGFVCNNEGGINWALDHSHSYKVKSAINLIRAGSIQNLCLVHPWQWQNIWSLRVIPKIKIFSWRLLQGGIPVKARFCQKGWKGSPSCDLWEKSYEDDSHVFFKCSYASQLWSIFYCKTGFKVTPLAILNLLRGGKKSMKTETSWWYSPLFFTSSWLIWFGRCQRVFRCSIINPNSLFKMIIKYFHNQLFLTK